MLDDSVTLELTRCRNSGEFCDMAFKCDGEKIAAHKIIVCAQSIVFRKALQSGLEESSGTYEIRDFDVGTVSKMVEFLYNGDYSQQAGEQEPPPATSTLLAHLDLFALADKYLLARLKSTSRQRFLDNLVQHFDINTLQQAAGRLYSSDFPKDESMRKTFISMTRIWMQCQVQDDDKMLHFRRLLDDVPLLTKDLFLSTVYEKSLGHCRHCRQMPVALEALQFKYTNCSKGGATEVSSLEEYKEKKRKRSSAWGF